MMSYNQIEREGPASAHVLALWQVVRVVAIVALLWLVSDQAYYAIVSALGLERGYDGAPVLFTAYYVGWSAAAAWMFGPQVAAGLNRARIAREALLLLPVLAALAAFVIWVLPLLPKVSELRAPPEPPEFMFASGWYYLPKSADILFQQVLVAALILTAARAGLGLRDISIGMAGAFGLFHLSLAFDGFTPLYVARFTLAATAFGAMLPWLYLRVRGGFRWAYSLHWGFYAVDAALTHFLLAAPPLAQT